MYICIYIYIYMYIYIYTHNYIIAKLIGGEHPTLLPPFVKFWVPKDPSDVASQIHPPFADYLLRRGLRILRPRALVDLGDPGGCVALASRGVPILVMIPMIPQSSPWIKHGYISYTKTYNKTQMRTMVLEDVPTFTPKMAQMWVNIPYMEHLGYITSIAGFGDDLGELDWTSIIPKWR